MAVISHSAVTEPVYTPDGNRQGLFINEDLIQAIRTEFLGCLSVLRRNLFSLDICQKYFLTYLDKYAAYYGIMEYERLNAIIRSVTQNGCHDPE